MARIRIGADAVCDMLSRLGVRHVFGVPGTQSIDLWESLRRLGPKPIVATNELAASFMANGYARASGGPGVVVTIPGPGFTYALTGLAEALLDSVPLVHIAGAPAARADGGYALQAIRQAEIAAPLVKQVITAASADEIGPGLIEAFAVATTGEPGPVLVQVPEAVLGGPARPGPADPRPTADEGGEPTERRASHAEAGAVADRLAQARRPVLLCGQGAFGAAELVTRLAEALPAPVLTTTSGRGVVSELHPSALPFDSPGAPTSAINELLDQADLIVAIGVKFSHNGSLGFALRLPQERLIRVDASGDVLARGYPAAVSVEADAAQLLAAVHERLAARTASEWTPGEVAAHRTRLASAAASVGEPQLAGGPAADVFRHLREAMPAASVAVADSGLHQYLLRRHLSVLAPRTLLVPANLQSMGFGLPAAIGAAVATGSPAFAVIGDGGFALGGLELATAVHAGIPLVVLVLVDGSFGLIRLQQLRRTGHESGVDLPAIDVGLVAQAVGAEHVRLETDRLGSVFPAAAASGKVTVVEVPVGDGHLKQARRQGLAQSAAGTLLGRQTASRLKRIARGGHG